MFGEAKFVTNRSLQPLPIWFESLGLSYVLLPVETFQIVGESKQPGMIEVTERENCVAIMGGPVPPSPCIETNCLSRTSVPRFRNCRKG